MMPQDCQELTDAAEGGERVAVKIALAAGARADCRDYWVRWVGAILGPVLGVVK